MYAVKHPRAYWKVTGEWVQNTVSVDGLKSYHKTLMYIFLVFVPLHMFMS